MLCKCISFIVHDVAFHVVLKLNDWSAFSFSLISIFFKGANCFVLFWFWLCFVVISILLASCRQVVHCFVLSSRLSKIKVYQSSCSKGAWQNHVGWSVVVCWVVCIHAHALSHLTSNSCSKYELIVWNTSVLRLLHSFVIEYTILEFKC